MKNKLISMLGAVCLSAPLIGTAADFAGNVDVTPLDPGTNIGVGVELTAGWTTNKNVTRWEWLVDGNSQGVSTMDAQSGVQSQTFTFFAAGDYEVCFHIWHHNVNQSDRDVVDCSTVTVIGQTCTWIQESATSDGDDYPGANWFTYTPYPGYEISVPLCAGSKCLNAGTVLFSDPVDDVVTITIDLNAGWRFRDVDDTVKIQDYASAPSEAIPGHFSYKFDAKTSPFSAAVPDNNYFGVHADVERCVFED